MTARRILLMTVDAAGNWTPILQLVRALVVAGHNVRVVSQNVHEGATVRAGGRFEPYRFASIDEGPDRLPVNEEAARAVREWLANDDFASEFNGAITRERPDVCLIDPVLQRVFAPAEAAGIPFVLLAHTLFGSTLGQNRSRIPLDPVNTQRASLGLSPLADPLAMCERAAAILCFSYPELDRPCVREIPQLHYVGPLLESAAPAPFELPWESADTRPLVLVAFSTSFQDQVATLQRVIDTLGSLPVRGLVTLGHAVTADEFTAPANVSLVAFAPHGSVLPRAQLVITHAGHGTVMAAATAGVPLLCMPMGRDQPLVAAGAERAGIATVISPQATVDEIRTAIAAALEDAALAQRARQFAATRDLEAGRRHAVEVIEGVA